MGAAVDPDTVADLKKAWKVSAITFFAISLFVLWYLILILHYLVVRQDSALLMAAFR